jgi:hypothetical protein
VGGSADPPGRARTSGDADGADALDDDDDLASQSASLGLYRLVKGQGTEIGNWGL